MILQINAFTHTSTRNSPKLDPRNLRKSQNILPRSMFMQSLIRNPKEIGKITVVAQIKRKKIFMKKLA